MDRARWGATRARQVPNELIPGAPEPAAGRLDVGYAATIGRAVYDRRTALNLSQAEVARRAGMTQPQVSRIESGDTVPTLPLLERLAGALESELEIRIVPHTARHVTFHPRPAIEPAPEPAD